MQPITIYPPTALSQVAAHGSIPNSGSALPHSTTTIYTSGQLDWAVSAITSIRRFYRRSARFFTTITQYIETNKYRWRYNWMIFQSVMATLNRRADLRRLVRWAKRKRLSGPLRAYEWQLQDIETQLLHHDFKHPRLLKRARWLHRLNALITPRPKYYPKGYAAQYSRVNNHSQRRY